MLFNIKENEIKKKKILLLLFLFLIYEQCLFKFVYSFAVSRRSLVLNSLGDTNGGAHVKKKKIIENKKLLLDIGNSLKENDMQKSLIHLDNLLNNYEHDKKFSKSMSMLCGNVLNLCSRFNDINSMIKIIESMKEKKIEMLENSYLAICNYYISNNYIYEYLLTINKMIEKNITIRERFYKHILVRIIDLPLDESTYEKILNPSNSLSSNSYETGGKNKIKNNRKINNNEKDNNNVDKISVKSKRCNLINNIDYDNFKEYIIKLNKYNINLEEEDKKYILNNYLIIDIFNHMNSNKIKIKLIYVLKLIHYVYENIQHVIKKIDDHYIFNDIKNNKEQNDREENADKISVLKNILMEQIQTILELYKNNYESMNINIKKIQENLDEEEKRNLYYCVNKIVKKIPFIKLTENIKNTYNCKNCDENINTYFLTLKQVIIAIINIILITHLFNYKEIYKIKHFFSILNGDLDSQTSSTQNEDTKSNSENVEKQGDDNTSNKSETKGSFQNTRDIKKHFNVGTYTCLLDGANIGYNKQNVENGRFSFLQIEILKEIIKKKKNETPLIILPKIYHYKNSLKYLQGEHENEEEKTSDIFIPNKTIKIKKKNTTNQGENDNKQNDALSYIKKIFNKLDNTDVDIIKKWEKEKCLYICNYNMYDDYYYILGSLAKGNNLFNIYYYIDMLSKHYFICENLNHNIIIDYYSPNDDSTLGYSHREILHIHNNLIYDQNTNIMVLVTDDNIKMESKYISMNEQYYNDKIKKQYQNINSDNNNNYGGSNNAFKQFEKYKKNLNFKDKDEINYEKNIFMETYRYDPDTGNHLLMETQYESEAEKQVPEKGGEKSGDKKGLHYSNIYIKCVKNSDSTQKPIYIYTNDKMKNHYFNEYTNFILKKWKKKSFVSFYFKQPISLDDLKRQSENGDIDINDIIHNYKLPYINLENSKLYIDDIISYKNKKIYHVKINSPGKTFLSYQNENIPFMHYNSNIVKYLCIDLSRI